MYLPETNSPGQTFHGTAVRITSGAHREGEIHSWRLALDLYARFAARLKSLRRYPLPQASAVPIALYNKK